MIKACVLGFSVFVLFLAVHVIVFRSVSLKERFRAMTWIFYALIPLYALLYLLFPADYALVAASGPEAMFMGAETAYTVTLAMYFLAGLMLYVFLFLGYCQFYFIVDRSISVRVMMELESSPDGKLGFDEIMKVYSFRGILERRLEHMLDGGYIVFEGGRYRNTVKGRAEARLFAFLKGLLRLGPGG